MQTKLTCSFSSLGLFSRCLHLFALSASELFILRSSLMTFHCWNSRLYSINLLDALNSSYISSPTEPRATCPCMKASSSFVRGCLPYSPPSGYLKLGCCSNSLSALTFQWESGDGGLPITPIVRPLSIPIDKSLTELSIRPLIPVIQSPT